MSIFFFVTRFVRRRRLRVSSNVPALVKLISNTVLTALSLRSSLSQLVQVGWRTWAGILLITGISTGATLAIDVSDGSLDQLQEMWADTAAVNLNYFWSMFFLGWVLYLVNGLIWACFERSRASLILLTAKKEAIGDNVRASRWVL